MIVYITVPVVTKASFSPKNALDDEYKDLATEQAEQMMDDIITEVNIIIIMFQAIKKGRNIHQGLWRPRVSIACILSFRAAVT